MDHDHVQIDKKLDRVIDEIEKVKHRLARTNESQALILSNQIEALAKLNELLTRIKAPTPLTFIIAGESFHIRGLQQGEDMSYTVARDHQDEPFTVDPIVVADSEGPVEGTVFTERVESSNPEVVGVDGSNLHFGTFGSAVVSRIVTYQGNDFIVSALVFNVTPGALSFTGTMSVAGLTPDPEV